MKSTWVFGYGSLIWGTGKVKPVERREGILSGWHRDWTWISSLRHGAPTCSLQPQGEVKGVFYRLNPDNVDRDLEEFRRRERRDTEQMIRDLPEPEAVTYFWTMGSNLDRFPELSGLGRDQLTKALAERAKLVSEPGNDGIMATDYITKVHAFDPDDPITAAIARWL